MAVGFPVKADYVTGDVLTANNMNDLSGTLNTIQSVEYAAGKNRIINGDFRINQRGATSFTTTSTFIADRFDSAITGDGTVTFSRQAFTPGTAPLASYEGTDYVRIVTTGQTTSASQARMRQKIESVRELANQPVTISFYAKASTGTPSIAAYISQSFGTGGSPSSAVDTPFGKKSITTSWARYSFTATLPSISGKTIGTNNNDVLNVGIIVSAGSDFNTAFSSIGIQSNTFDIWGVQVGASSTASDFATATGTIQGELAACQRYYWNISGDNQYVGVGYNQSSTEVNVGIPNPVPMRTNPTLTVATGTNYYGIKRNGADDTFNSLSSSASFASVTGQMLFNSTEISGTAGQAGTVRTNNASAKIEFSAEL